MTVIPISEAKESIEVAAPPVWTGGILDVANVLPVEGHSLMGAEYVTDACAEGEIWRGICTAANGWDFGCAADGTPATPPALVKMFEQPDWVTSGDMFATYAGVECDLATGDAGARYSFAEHRLVDLEVQLFLASVALALPGPLPVIEAIGVMEDYAASVYGGVPTIVLPKSIVTCGVAEGVIIQELNGSLRTPNGAVVANVVNPTPGVVPATGYVTGQITLLRGKVKSFVTSPVTRPDGSCDPRRSLVEQGNVPLVECLTASLTVTCS